MSIDVFMTARDARIQATTSAITVTEIRAIELAIVQAVEANQLSVRVDNTGMTTPGSPDLVAERYYSVWQNLTADRVMAAQMDLVIRYFTDLGYSITRLVNGTTNNSFTWSIQW